MNQQQQPYNSSIKAIFNEDAPAILPLLLPGVEVIEILDFRVLPLWDIDGRQYVEQHKISMYTLLPMMQNVDATMLLQAIEELIEYSKGDESKLERRLLWLSTFLRRAEVMPPLEKQRVLERLKMFDELLEQDEFVQKRHERGLQQGRLEGKIEGKEEGQIEAFQMMLVDVVKDKFPSLEDLAQQRAEQTRKVDALREVIRLINAVNDENTVRIILNPSSAA